MEYTVELIPETYISAAEVLFNGNPVNATIGALSPMGLVNVTRVGNEVWEVKFTDGGFCLWEQNDHFACWLNTWPTFYIVEGLCGNKDGNVENDWNGANGLTNRDVKGTFVRPIFGESFRAFGYPNK